MSKQSTKSGLERDLLQFGMDKKRAAIYLALLQLGKAPVQLVAKTSGVKRTTVYSILKSLEEDGLVSRTIVGKKQIFVVDNPSAMMSRLESKKTALELLLPELNSLYNALPSKPCVHFYEGIEGIKAIFEDTLVSRPKEILDFSSLDDLVNVFGDYMKSYTKRRAELGVQLRAIVMDTPFARKYNARYYTGANPVAVPNFRFIPAEKFMFKTEINIYGNKVAIMSLKEEELVGVIIESAVIADTHRSIFELAWHAAGMKL
ncbi:MAG: helix-turn-helix domain-containing protein [bacterium]|nr:helix-turn-helix domain-containing protein [bacterium]